MFTVLMAAFAILIKIMLIFDIVCHVIYIHPKNKFP